MNKLTCENIAEYIFKTIENNFQEYDFHKDPFPCNSVFYIDAGIGNRHKKIIFRITNIDISDNSINSFTLHVSDGENHESYPFLLSFIDNSFLEEFETMFLRATN